MIPDSKTLKDAYKTAPQPVRAYITSPELNSVFQTIRKNYGLHVDEAGALSNALNAVFLELVPFDKFSDLLKEALKGSSDKHTQILGEINEKVFVVFRNKLQEAEQKEEQVATTAADAATQPEKELPEVELNPVTEASIIQNEPTEPKEAAPTQTTETTPRLDKLEEVVNSAVTDVEMQEPSAQEKGAEAPPQASQYTGDDPYREKIE